MRFAFTLAALLLAASPALADEKIVGDMVINLGLMPAWQAMQVEGHREAHSHQFVSRNGSQHLLIVVADKQTGKRLGEARVVVEVIDPKGRAEKKALARTQAAGQPDYSEVFEFGWSGSYDVRVNVVPIAGAKPVNARFTVHHAL
jgi:hypothetical protein